MFVTDKHNGLEFKDNIYLVTFFEHWSLSKRIRYKDKTGGGGDENIVNRSITNSTGLIWSSRGIFDKDVKQVEFQIYEFFTFYYMSDS